MKRSKPSVISVTITALFVLATGVNACEGDCIKGVVNAVIGNYSLPLHLVLTNLSNTIESRIFPNKQHTTTTNYLRPIISEYNNLAYNTMENAIFKSYFHGKCQNPETGVNPAGCPNPDCPVVCGTPGSIVHFYDKFKKIGFDTTAHLISNLMETGSPAYQKVEKDVRAELQTSRTTRRVVRFVRASIRGQRYTQGGDDSLRKTLRSILDGFQLALIKACGGTETGQTNGLPNCSWEERMKEYILSFP